jgi:hypothetical protein
MPFILTGLKMINDNREPGDIDDGGLIEDGALAECTSPQILVAVTILAGDALTKGDRRLYEHLYSAVNRYKTGEDLGWSLRLGDKDA